MIAITGATGQLGQLVIKHLLTLVQPSEITAIVRDLEKAKSLADQGIQLKQADYSDVIALEKALEGIDSLLLISSSEVGQRAAQHQNVIEAAKKAGVPFMAYTSILNADSSPLALAEEHILTEKALADSGLSYTLLRNGWYSENYLASVAPSVEHGAFIGSAKDGKISSAAREDYATAAAIVVSAPSVHSGKVYELAGDDAYTLTELASLISKKAGKEVPYVDLPEGEFAKALESAGLPGPFAAILADSDVGASKNALFDDSKTLSSLIGRPTKSLDELIGAFL